MTCQNNLDFLVAASSLSELERKIKERLLSSQLVSADPLTQPEELNKVDEALHRASLRSRVSATNSRLL